MLDLDYKESWALENWCFWTVELEKTLESPLDCKKIQPVHTKGNQSWIFIGRTDAEAETPTLWPPDVKKWLRKRPWYWERLKTRKEGDNRGWDGWTASPTQWTWVWANSGSWWWTGRPDVLWLWGCKELDTTEQLNWTELKMSRTLCHESRWIAYNHKPITLQWPSLHHNLLLLHHFNKGLSIQSYGFSTSHVWMWEFDYKESWMPKNWHFWTVVLEKTLESPLDCKEIQPILPKGNKSWIFTGRTDVEAETPILWPLDAKNWLIWKDPDAGRDWR